MVDEINRFRLPQFIPDIGLPEQPFEERKVDSWEYRQGNTAFNFVNGRIQLNNQDLSRLISENLTHLATAYWTQIARRLQEYRQWALAHIQDPDQLAIFAAMVQALLSKLGGRLKKKYDEKIDGIAFQLEEGQLLLNGINVNAFLEMAKRNPTQKAKIFLKGLKNRLGVMLTNRMGNPSYEKIRSTVHDLFEQIDAELVKPPVEPSILLLPARSVEGS
ncbi:MAG: hypothetical protein JNK65_03280 [Deltaproteobacteria bacterium]|nr:hypothetical protein [Deltaproteobacteria bacterium]